jgi:hypothetical protein
VSLRLPKEPPGLGQKFACPKCRGTIYYDHNT